MPNTDISNRITFSVPRENLEALETCVKALFPWDSGAKQPHELTFLLHPGQPEPGVVVIVGSKAASDLARIAKRTRMQNPELDKAFVEVDLEDLGQHECTAVVVDGRKEWEARVAGFQHAENEHPEWQVKVLRVERADRCHAWLRIGLLGPFRNTLDMQCVA